jgi:two-component sensor histidine kinase
MHQSAEKISLVIADNGIGIDPAIIKTEKPSMGINLMKGLTGEMDGKIDIVNENGTTIRIGFHTDPLDEFSSPLVPRKDVD